MVELCRKVVNAVLGMLVLLAGSSRLRAVDCEPVWLRGGKGGADVNGTRKVTHPCRFSAS